MILWSEYTHPGTWMTNQIGQNIKYKYMGKGYLDFTYSSYPCSFSVVLKVCPHKTLIVVLNHGYQAPTPPQQLGAHPP